METHRRLDSSLSTEARPNPALRAAPVQIFHPLPLVQEALQTLIANLPTTAPVAIATLAELGKAAGQGRLVALIDRADRRQVSEARSNGAIAAIPLDLPTADLRAALASVLAGRSWWPVTLDLQTQQSPFARKLETLSGQQWRVLDLMSKGRLNKQIAYDLGISEGTVKSHVSAILRKLGVERRTQAIANYVAQEDARIGGSAGLSRAYHAAR